MRLTDDWRSAIKAMIAVALLTGLAAYGAASLIDTTPAVIVVEAY